MKTIKWNIEPLGSKYYGTVIRSSEDDYIRIWTSSGNGNTSPSVRELEIIKEDFKEVEDSFLSFEEFVKDYYTDGHYESQGDYEIATGLVNLLNHV